ncbi:MAG: hypothetical protein S4CHLAM45_14100 [Chlamydiales bacterium]|nr:hypothetical protein [Chlamydiales bacterium]MCH9620515.1 hypothetical protein [Chlamydiales bacterium]MCH9623500.1 hypothetical protein [Chlamydiales bacterium]
MEEQREALYEKIEHLKELIFSLREKQCRLSHYHPKEGSKLSSLIAKKQRDIVELKQRLTQIDLDYNEETSSKPKYPIDKKDPKEELLALFHEGASLLQIKRPFILRPFLRHPKALLATIIQEAADLAKTIKTDNKKLSVFLNYFVSEAENPWNKELYKGKFIELYEEFKRSL